MHLIITFMHYIRMSNLEHAQDDYNEESFFANARENSESNYVKSIYILNRICATKKAQKNMNWIFCKFTKAQKHEFDMLWKLTKIKKRRKTQRMDLIIASSRGFQSDSHFGVVPLSCTKIYIRFVFAAMPLMNLSLNVIRCL